VRRRFWIDITRAFQRRSIGSIFAKTEHRGDDIAFPACDPPSMCMKITLRDYFFFGGGRLTFAHKAEGPGHNFERRLLHGRNRSTFGTSDSDSPIPIPEGVRDHNKLKVTSAYVEQKYDSGIEESRLSGVSGCWKLGV
jgi:hypothetical protein